MDYENLDQSGARNKNFEIKERAPFEKINFFVFGGYQTIPNNVQN